MGNRKVAEAEILKMAVFKWAEEVHSLTSRYSQTSPQFKDVLDQISKETEALVDDMIEGLSQGTLDRPVMEFVEQFNRHTVDLSNLK